MAVSEDYVNARDKTLRRPGSLKGKTRYGGLTKAFSLVDFLFWRAFSVGSLSKNLRIRLRGDNRWIYTLKGSGVTPNRQPTLITGG